MDKVAYTKLFLSHQQESITNESIKKHIRVLWQNTRIKSSGGLRLTDEGLDYLKNTLDLAYYNIAFPIDLDLKPQVLLFLDKFINCPYHITTKHITVFSERCAVELHLFSGDVRKYGLNKAMYRDYNNLLT